MSADLQLPQARRPAWRRLGPAGVLGAALMLHGVLIWLAHGPGPRTLMGDEQVYWPAAQRLAEGLAPQSYSPLWPPFYLHFLAGLVRVFGPRLLAVEIVQTLLLGLTAWMLGNLTERWSGSRLAGSVAAALTLIFPPLAAFAHYLWPEVLHLALFVGALWILSCRPRKGAWLASAGVLLGLALATKSLLLPFLPVLLAPLVFGRPARRGIADAAWVVLGIAVAAAPLRLAAGFGTLAAESAATFNVWVGLGDPLRDELADTRAGDEYEAYLRSADTLPERNAILRRKIRERVDEKGFVGLLRDQASRQYFRLFDKESFLIVQLRGKDLHPAAPGYRDPPPALAAGLVGASYLLYAAVLVGAVLGLAVAPIRKSPWLRVALAFLAYNLLLFLVVHVKTRYRIQLLPFLFVFSGCAAAWLAARRGGNRSEAELWPPTLSPARGLAGAAGAALVLFLAFGGPLLDVPEPAGVSEAAGPLRADPNPIRVCDGSGLGVTTLHWVVPAGRAFEVRIGSPDGPLFAAAGASGSAATGPWVRDGMTFVLVETEGGAVLGRTTVRLTRFGC